MTHTHNDIWWRVTVTHKVGEHHLPLMEEGKGDTQRHVVDAQGNWVSLLCSVLNGVREKKEQLSQVYIYIPLHILNCFVELMF